MIPRFLTFCVGAFLLASVAYSQTPQSFSVEPDSARWELEGQANATEYQGRKCLLLDGEKTIDAANAAGIAIEADSSKLEK